VAAVDPRLVRALREQLEQRDVLLLQGAERVGWKLGLSDRDRIGEEIAVGHITTATCLPSGASYVGAAGATELRADAEVVVELGRDVDRADDSNAIRESIAGYGAALEICDIGTLPNEPDSVVAANDFHRAVAFGDLRPALPPDVAGELIVNGALRASGAPPRDIPERLRAAARILAAVGEALRAGDRIITGLIVQVPIAVGDDVVARVDPHAPARLRIAA
jgi:2-keto-4-pentenoate hydratase